MRRDYPELLKTIIPILAPRGLLIACCNTLGKPYNLAAALEEFEQLGSPLKGPDLGIDIPQRKGFPEGRPFRLEVRRKIR